MTASGNSYVFLSPHPDDIALSLGSICGNADGRAADRLITVFSVTNFVAPDQPLDVVRASQIRMNEDLTFAREFAMARIDLGLPDFPLRTGLPVETCCSAPADATKTVHAALSSITWDENTTIFAPAGEGGHADHVSCRDAAFKLGQELGIPIIFYADMPYSVRAPGRIGPHYTLVPGSSKAWKRAVGCYPSQARLVDETVRLVGLQSPPMSGAYVSDRFEVVTAPRAGSASIQPRLDIPPVQGSKAAPVSLEDLSSGLHSIMGHLVIADQRAQVIQQRLQMLELESAADRSTILELRDSLQFACRRFTLRKDRTRVLFLIHMIETWDSYHEVVRAMEASDDFEPIVASIPRHFMGDGPLTFEDEVHRGLEQRGVKHLRLCLRDMADALRLVKSMEPDLIFRQSQWDLDIPDVFATDRLDFARLCLIPYETMNIVQNNPWDETGNSAVDMPYHRRAWAVFCANDLVLDIARRDGVRAGAQFHVVGHPKVDMLRNATPGWPVTVSNRAAPKKRIAWSAHHSIGDGWTNFGAFHLMAAEMLHWAQQKPDTEFVFLPHPALIPYTKNAASPVNNQQFEEWLSAWKALPNTGFSASGEYPGILAASDLLVTDGLSLLIEYQIFEKPLIFFERMNHRPFNEIGDIALRGAHAVSNMVELRRMAERLLVKGDDQQRRTQREIVQRLFGGTPSAPRVLDTLRKMIESERGDRSALSLV